MDTVHERSPRLVGSTGDLYDGLIAETKAKDLGNTTQHIESHSVSATYDEAEQEANYFKSAQWSGDGTTILTSSADNTLKTFILPPDLLSSQSPHIFRPYTTHILPSPAYALAIYPTYDLSTAATGLYIASVASLPIRLISPFVSGILASYPLINATTEAYIAPHSILFDTYGSNGNQFYAGSDSELSVFDINRNGEGPLIRMKTIPSRRKKIVGGGVGVKGIISALALSSEGLLAAGTFGRWLGLYGSGGRGDVAGVFEVGKIPEDEDEVGDGAGITQLLWSQCGRYLCVVERGSDGIGVWDIRRTGKRVAWFRGRAAKTMQRLSVDIFGNDVWCGGTDGLVRVWEGIGLSEGVLDPVWSFGAHNDSISSTIVHSSGTVFATCCGQRREQSLEDMSNMPQNSPENRLKVWAT